jgi:mRNA-degrading endonuclease RelE of RelBE toxin-antitoxin system
VPYKVEIATTKSNIEFLQKLPKEILPEIAKRLNILGVKPYLGRSVEGPISAYIYTFSINHMNKVYNFLVSYKINENKETITITDFGKTMINYS